MSKLNMAPNECSCTICQQMCKRPCWGTPEDAKKLIDAGYSHRLMRDYWGERDENARQDIYILSPALKGYEGHKAPFYPRSSEGCTFWKDGLCELHDLGLKPTEGKLSTCKPDENEDEDEIGLHEEIYLTWKNAEAQKFCEEWTEKYIKIDDEEDPITKLLEFIQGMSDSLQDLIDRDSE